VVRSGNPRQDKERARWLLRQAREQISLGNLDDAERKLTDARGLNVRYNLFGEDTPTKVSETLQKARAQAAKAPGAGAAPKDKKLAMQRLREARQLLATGQIDQAEAMALDVGTWGVHFGVMGDNPGKVVAAAKALRRRNDARNSGGAGISQDIYDTQVKESRALLAEGKVDEAESRARQAQRLNVVPGLNADRAESVLHDIAMQRARAAAPAGATDPNAGLALNNPNVGAAAAAGDDALVRVQAPSAAPGAEPAAPSVLDPAQTQPMPPDAAPAPVAPEANAPQAGLAEANPAQEPAPAVAPEGAVPTQPAATGNMGEELLNQAKALMASGNLGEAKRVAAQAQSGGFGVDLQANEVLAQIALAQQASAQKMYEAALQAMRKQDYDHARAMLNELSVTDIQDDSLGQRIQDLLTRIPADKAGKANLGPAVEDAEMVKSQKLNIEVGTKVAEARRLMETDPDKAIKLLESTLEAVKNSGVNAAAARTMTRRIEVAIELAKKDKVAFDVKMQDKAGRAEIEQKRLRILEADKEKKAQVDSLMQKATEAQTNGDFAVAEQLARRAAQIDPNNVAATALATVARIRRHYERDLATRREKDEGVLDTFQSIDETGIIPPEMNRGGIVYAKTFNDMTRSRRELASRLAPKKDPKLVAIQAKLKEPITLNLDKQPLGDALNFIAQYTGLNVITDPTALAEEGATLSTPVSLRAKDLRLEAALKYILGPLHLTYKVDDGDVLLITSPGASRSKTFPVAYPVADLVISPHAKPAGGPNAPAPGTVPAGANGVVENVTNPALGTNGNAQNGSMGLGIKTAEGPQSLANDRASADFGPLINLIKSSVAPGTWRDGPDDETSGGYGMGAGAGGADANPDQAVGSITPFFLNISLIIRHTSEVHDDIVDLLRQLRRLQDLQVSIEVRFITVSDSFFEQIGVDFDFSIQSDAIGRKSTFAFPNTGVTSGTLGGNTTGGTIGGGTAGGTTGGGLGGTTGGAVGGGTATATSNPYIINPIRDHTIGRAPLVVGLQSGGIGNFSPNLQIPFVQNSASAITPFNALATGTTATFGISFLSDLEVYLFLTAVQGDTRSNIVQAPKVTTFNGAGATVTNVTNRYYVASLIPIVGAGAVAFQPTIAPLPDGVILNVTPVVSADRRYVRMTMSPFFQTFIAFDTFTIPAAVGGGGLGGQATAINGQVQLPETAITNVTTTVTVPDGGTVLLGGVKRLHEERLEFGVPILSKTPLINRLFRNIGIGRTTDSLMLMVTPRIIILEEEEEKLGIPNVQNVTF
jgi:type II secretory pathway component GspD/PulD (secretin)